MSKKALKLSSIEIDSFVIKDEKLNGGADYSNTFTTSSTDARGCTMLSGCPCNSFEAPCLDMP